MSKQDRRKRHLKILIENTYLQSKKFRLVTVVNSVKISLWRTFTNLNVFPTYKFAEFNGSLAVLMLVSCDHDLEFGFSIAFFTPCPFHTHTHTHTHTHHYAITLE
jgi:hypothetical protein